MLIFCVRHFLTRLAEPVLVLGQITGQDQDVAKTQRFIFEIQIRISEKTGLGLAGCGGHVQRTRGDLCMPA